MERFFDNMKEGQILVTVNGEQFAAVNPHRNTDEPDNPFIVYDDKGNSYFEEDIDVKKSLSLMDPNHEPEDHIIFSKFHIPPEATAVQAALIYTTDNGETWSNQIPAELTIACPEELEYLPVNGKQSQMRTLAHNFIEDTWRNGFNTCLELFKNGKIDTNDDQTNHIPHVTPEPM